MIRHILFLFIVIPQSHQFVLQPQSCNCKNNKKNIFTFTPRNRWAGPRNAFLGFSPTFHGRQNVILGAHPNTKSRGSSSTSSASSENAKREATRANNNSSSTNTTRKSPEYKSLYPPAKLLRNGTLQVDSTHSIYYEEYVTNQTTITNNQKNKVALSLHGGPGAASFPNHARFFDPNLYSRVILYDQRGSGKSQPRGEIQNNTLHHLVMDIENLRLHLGRHGDNVNADDEDTTSIDKWDVILGGSWGCTLALAYAQRFPKRVGGLVLRGVCTMRTKEVDWVFGMGSSTSSSDETNVEEKLRHVGQLNRTAWDMFEQAVAPTNEDGNITSTTLEEDSQLVDSNFSNESLKRKALHRYYDRLLGTNTMVRAQASMAWFQWEMKVSSISVPDSDDHTAITDDDDDDSHYDLNVWNPELQMWTQQRIDSSNDTVPDDKNELKQAIFNPAKLRRWSNGNLSTRMKNEKQITSPDASLGNPRPIEPLDESIIKEADSQGVTQTRIPKDYIPAQAMLTCYYSVNNEYMLSDFDLLSKENIDRIRSIPCIAVQGANDLICPPDTALDLHEVWPEMELRICNEGKHSMYDPPITAELIKATDRLGSD